LIHQGDLFQQWLCRLLSVPAAPPPRLLREHFGAAGGQPLAGALDSRCKLITSPGRATNNTAGWIRLRSCWRSGLAVLVGCKQLGVEGRHPRANCSHVAVVLAFAFGQRWDLARVGHESPGGHSFSTTGLPRRMVPPSSAIRIRGSLASVLPSKLRGLYLAPSSIASPVLLNTPQ